MEKTVHNVLSENLLKVLRPLVRVLIRNGVSSGTLEELVRRAYVDEAYSISKKLEQKTTVSSISAQTGLSRKEVKRLSELDNDTHSDVEQKYNRGVRVIGGWINDENFTDADSKAKNLTLDESPDSFSALIKKYSGDIPTKAMLDLLIAADCVQVNNNEVQLIKHAYVPGNDSTEIIGILGTDTNELINTIDYNLTSADEDKRYQRKVSTALLNKNTLNEFKTLSEKRSQELLEELDAWLSKHEVDTNDPAACYVSLGVYYYQNDSQEK